METRRWLNQSQPQMLANATILLYLNAAFALIGGSVFPLLTLAGAAGGFGIANDKLWGYYLGIFVAVIPTALTVAQIMGLIGAPGLSFNLTLTLMLQVVLVVLLLHPTSRSYTRIWFK